MATKRTSAKTQTLSWIDRFFDWVERLPLPFYLVYLLGYLAVVSTYHITLWTSGALPNGELSQGILFTTVFWIFLQMAAFHYFQNQAESALLHFRPALDVSDKEFAKLRFSFINFSAPRALIGGLASVGAALALFLGPIEIVSPLFKATPLATAITFFLLMGSPFAFGFFYFVFRSLVGINRLYRKVKHINLFNLGPLYVLSRFTSRVGMLFILYLVINALTTGAWGSQESGEAIASFYYVVNGLIAVFAFVLPLWGIHVRMAAAKEAASTENNQMIQEHFSAIQKNVKQGRMDKVTALRTGNAALLEYRTELSKISTWPWDTATLRTFVTALAVPMTVWIVQQVLTRTIVR
ncbi:MAG: hypothetical protein WEC16_02105 [Anaerolineales bacterium]